MRTRAELHPTYLEEDDLVASVDDGLERGDGPLGRALADEDLRVRVKRAPKERAERGPERLPQPREARRRRVLVERVDVSPSGADIRLRLEGLASLMRDLRPDGLDRRAA